MTFHEWWKKNKKAYPDAQGSDAYDLANAAWEAGNREGHKAGYYEGYENGTHTNRTHHNDC